MLAQFIRDLHERGAHVKQTLKGILSNGSRMEEEAICQKIWGTAWQNFTAAVAADRLKKTTGAISTVVKPEATVEDVKPDSQPAEEPKVVKEREELGIRKEAEIIAKNIYKEHVLTVVAESKNHELLYTQLCSSAKVNPDTQGRFLGLFVPRSHSECSPYQNRNPYAIDAPIDEEELKVLLNLMVKMIRPSQDFAIVFEGRGFNNRRIVTNAMEATKLQIREIVLQYEAAGLSELYSSGQSAKSPRKRRRKGRFMDSGSREALYVLWKGNRPQGCEKLGSLSDDRHH